MDAMRPRNVRSTNWHLNQSVIVWTIHPSLLAQMPASRLGTQSRESLPRSDAALLFTDGPAGMELRDPGTSPAVNPMARPEDYGERAAGFEVVPATTIGLRRAHGKQNGRKEPVVVPQHLLELSAYSQCAIDYAVFVDVHRTILDVDDSIAAMGADTV